ncbi:MAG: hypothetical protein IJZ86_06250 [Bacteroides sp.]|nr:hypothetical protein [Bacteroides sp.]
MKRVFTAIALMLVSLWSMGQAKKPTLMVMPSPQWCNERGYMQEFDNEGNVESVPDYAKALLNDKELNNVISKIGILMTERGFDLKDLQQNLRSINNSTAEDMLITNKSGDSGLKESPIDRLRRTAKADIILEIDWTLNQTGPKQSITYNLKGLDAYTNKQIAGSQGTGAPSFSAEVAVLLEEAVQNNMENFCSQLQSHFDDLQENGREVIVEVRVFENDLGIDLESEVNGMELLEIIETWMHENTEKHRFNISDATENYILFEQVRIPLYRANGMAMDTRNFVNQLRNVLRKEPYNIPCKTLQRGLGKCLLIIGDK